MQVLSGGTVRTLDAGVPQAAALAVHGDSVVALSELPGYEPVALGGRCVVPGFSDCHVHFPSWSLAQRQVRLEGVTSLDHALRLVADAARALPAGAWLRGYGWRDHEWTHPPTRWALDRVAPGVPVALMSKDYHSLWVSSEALARADELEVPGGVVEREPDGEPLGVLREMAAWRFRDRYVQPTMDEMVEASREGMRIANSRGVTAVHDKDGWLKAFEVFERLWQEDELTLRVWQSFPHEQLDHLRAIGLRSGFGNDLLRAGYLKVFMDGTLGSATAHLLDGSGTEITSRQELEEIVRRGAEAGFPVGVHAIGDAANRAALDALEATRDAWSALPVPPRIEHAQLLAGDDVARFGRLGVAASVQFSHAPSDRDLADRLWEGRSHGAYAFRSLLEAGTLLVNGSDAPIEELDPLMGVVAGVLRTLDEREAWHPEQALSVEQAFEATCVAPARLAGDSHRRGTLAPGRLADLVVLDRDPFECPPEELPEIEVVATMVGGEWVHNPPPW